MPTPYEDLLGIISGRRSIRSFSPEPVPDALLDQLFEAARWAPSAGNRQAYRLWLITDPERRRQLVDLVAREVERLRGLLRPEARTEGAAYLDQFTRFGQAPALVAAIYRGGTDLLQASTKSGTGAIERAGQDALASCAAAIQNLLLAAHSLDLGACWMTGPLVAGPGLTEALAIPEGWDLAALIPVGFPAETPDPPPRRSLSRLVRRLD